jgi:hypothetical protein
MNVYERVWGFVRVSIGIWSCLVICGRAWSCLVGVWLVSGRCLVMVVLVVLCCSWVLTDCVESIRGCVWTIMNVYERVRTSVHVSRGIWPCLVIFGRAWSCLIVSGRCRCLVMVCCSLLPMGLDGSCRVYSWMCMDGQGRGLICPNIFGRLWGCLVVPGPFWSGLVVCNRDWLVSGRHLVMVCFSML